MLSVQIIQGAQPGRWQEFDEDIITIGRGAEADFSVDHSDTTVSRGTHLTLAPTGADDGSYSILATNLRDNPVFVISIDETRFRLEEGESRVLTDSFKIQVGDGGPVLSISSDHFLSPTIKKNVDLSSIRISGIKAKAIDEVQFKSRFSLKLVVLLFVGLSIGFYLLNEIRVSDSAQDARLSDLNLALASSINSAVEAREFSQNNFDQIYTSMDEFKTEVASTLSSEIGNQARGILDRVYLVGIKNSDGSFTGLGTAWKIGPKLLSTNAHVVEGLEETFAIAVEQKSGNVKVVALLPGSGGSGGVEFDILKMRSHGGYEKYLDGNPDVAFKFDPVGFPEVISFIPVFDVGLLETRIELPGDSLVVANPTELAALESGDPIGMVGFPSSAIGNTGNNPDPILSVGNLLSQMDPYGDRAPTNQRVVLGVDLKAGPGSSGSPIISTDGKVIGLLAHATGGELHNFQFAQRADLVQAMVDDNEHEQLLSMEQYWIKKRKSVNSAEAHLEMLLLVGQEEIFDQLITYFGSEKTPEEIRDMMNPVEVYSKTLRVSESDPAVYKLWDNLEEEGLCILVAISQSGLDIDLVGRYADGSEVQDVSRDYFPVITFPIRKSVGINLNLILPTDRSGDDEVLIKLVRVISY
jgi:hypothetical protein